MTVSIIIFITELSLYSQLLHYIFEARVIRNVCIQTLRVLYLTVMSVAICSVGALLYLR